MMLISSGVPVHPERNPLVTAQTQSTAGSRRAHHPLTGELAGPPGLERFAFEPSPGDIPAAHDHGQELSRAAQSQA